ncbi:hypothetical protein HZB74_01230 [Candidatus Saccharibacteria bacterium]|nr:hypothetical protein [Candidatus Saccharibacteria bacterium]
MVFSLVASKALLDQRAYQSKVISKKEAALKTLEANIVAADKLTSSYKEFVGATTNVLGGNPQGDADRDGDNARIILDALPSKYDFPALTTSLDKLLRDNGLTPTAINGTDDEISQTATQADGAPQPVEIPFSVEVTASNAQGKTLMGLFERSIRPFKVQKISISGNDSQLEFVINGSTYFQPEKTLNLKKEAVK